MKQFMMKNATNKELDLLLQYYPDDQSAGSPFGTGIKNVIGMFLVRVGLIETEVDR
jgi:hypothetical protein